MGTTDEFFRAEGPDDISGGPAACGFEARSMRAPTTEGPFTAVFEVGVGGIGTKVGAEGRAGAFVPEDGPPNNNVFSDPPGSAVRRSIFPARQVGPSTISASTARQRGWARYRI
jgi:hypothetical protein